MSEEEEKANLGDSYRQSRKELLFMIGAWCFFVVWALSYVGMNGTSEVGEPLKLMWGMPHWVVVGIVIPWIFALLLTVWFALRFMKDTDLDPESSKRINGEEAK